MMIHNNIHASVAHGTNLTAFCIPADSGSFPAKSFYDKSYSPIATAIESDKLLKLERQIGGSLPFIPVARCLSDNPAKDVTGTFGRSYGKSILLFIVLFGCDHYCKL